MGVLDDAASKAQLLVDNPQVPTNNYSGNPILLAADNHNLANGESSWYDPSTIGDFVGASAVSAALQLANSAIAIGRWTGVTNADNYNIGDQMYKIDNNLGDYYNQHGTAADVAGMLAGSFVPMGLGAKLYGAGSKMLGAAVMGDVGENSAGALGLIPSIQKSLISQAVETMGSSGTAMSFMNPNVAMSLGLGVVEDYAQGTVMLGLATAAMNQSPLFDGMSVSDLAADTFSLSPLYLSGSLLNRAAKIYGKVRGETAAITEALNPHRQATAVTGNATPADQLMAWAGDIKTRPEIDPTAENAALLQQTQDKANASTILAMRAKALEVTGGDVTAARTLVGNIVNDMGMDEVLKSVPNMQSFKRLAEDLSDSPAMAAKVLSGLKNDADVVGAVQAGTIREDALQAMKESTSPATNFQPAQLRQAGKNSLVINRVTDEVLDDYLPTLGDTLGKDDAMAVSKNGRALQVGADSYPQLIANNSSLSVLDGNRMAAEARYIYALEATSEQIAKTMPEVVGQYDFPMMERRVMDGDISLDRPVKINMGADNPQLVISSVPELKIYLSNQKEVAAAFLRENGASTQEVSQRLNVSNVFAKDPSIIMNDANVDKHYYRMQNSTYRAIGTNEVVKPYMEPTHYITRYDAPLKTQMQYAKSITLGAQYLAMKEAAYDKTVGQAVANVLGDDKAALLPDRSSININNTTQYGAGGQLLSFARGEYRSTAESMEAIGKVGYTAATERIKDTLGRLNPYATALGIDKAATTEFNMIDNLLRRVGSAEGDLGAFYNLARDDAGKMILLHPNDVADIQLAAARVGYKMANSTYTDMVAWARHNNVQLTKSYYVQNEAVADFLQSHVESTAARQAPLRTLMEAKGLVTSDLTGRLYAPPLDTAATPFYAFVRDLTAGGRGISMINARDAKTLQSMIADVKANFPHYDVITNADSNAFFKAKGEYSYDNSITENYVNSTLQRKGIQNFLTPPTDSTKMIDSYLNWHTNQETSLVRSLLGAKYGQVFDSIEALGKDSLAAQGATWKGKINDLVAGKANNPWMDYRRTALFIPKNTNTVVRTLDDFITKTTDGAWNDAKQIIKTAFTKMDPEELDKLNDVLDKNGLGRPYTSAATVALANMNVDKGVLRKFIGRAQGILSSLMLGMDPFQALNNHIGSYIQNSSEIVNIKSMLKSDPKFADVAKLIEQRVPGTDIYQTSPVKLIASAIADCVGDSGKALLAKYQSMGFDLSEIQQMRSVINDLSVANTDSSSMLMTRLDKAFDTASKISLTKKSEQFNRILSARIIDKLSSPLVEAGLMDEAGQHAMMNNFINRVHGNFIASQRPQIFQGVLGSAASLYQTYTWNLMQQMFRNIGEGSNRAVFTALAMQGSLYGMSNLPGFNQLNNLIAMADGNPEHHDIFDTMSAGGKDGAEWMMYGLGSNVLGLVHPSLKTSLFTRGDINPRSWSVLPTNPMDFPVVSTAAKAVGSIYNAFKKIEGGGAVGASILEGIEHMGLNRPITGFAQVLNGQSTNNDGTMLSAVDLSNAETYIRFLGGRPMNEALAMQAVERTKSYMQSDKDAKNTLGEIIKTQVKDGQIPDQATQDKFARQYAESGGNLKNFSAFYARNALNANQSLVNTMVNQNKSFVSTYMQHVMGGDSLSTNYVTPTPTTANLSGQSGQGMGQGRNQ